MVDNCCVVVVDGSRARFLTLESAKSPSEGGPFLEERLDLVNPEADARGRDLWSEAKSGRGRESSHGPAHGYDDHREEHEDEFKRRFAARIVDEMLTLARSHGSSRVVVAAEKQMLGFLRPAMAGSLDGLEVRELAKDLSKLSPTQLQERLAKEELLPPRVPPSTRRG